MNTIFILSISIFSILGLIIIYGLYFWKGKVIGLLTSLIFGILGMVLLLILVNVTSFDDTEILDTTRDIFAWPGRIFINLILIMVPIYLIFIISSLVFSENFTNIKKRTYGVSFASLLTISLIGIVVAVLLTPFVLLVPDSLWSNITLDDQGGVEETASINWAMIIVFSTIILAFVVSIIIRISLKSKLEKINKNTNMILGFITNYFKLVIKLVPLVLFTRLTTIGMTKEISEASSTLSIMGIYLGLFMFGSIIIFSMLYTYIIFMSDKDKTTKEKIKLINNYLLISFSNQSAAASLQDTQNTVKELGVCDEIATLTPVKGLFMGMVMCNGFTPMLMSIMIFGGAGTLTLTNIFIAAGIIFLLSISTSGAGSSDYWITATTMKIMGPSVVTNEIFDALYLNIILVAQELNEMTIAKPINGLGHISATLTTEKYHQHISKCDKCDEHGDHSHHEHRN